MELSSLAQFASFPVRAQHWFVLLLKGLQVLGREGLHIPISKASFRRNWYRVSQKKSCRRLNLLVSIGSLIAKAHQLNYSFLIFIMYLFLSCKSLLFYFINSIYNSSYINAVPHPRAQRRSTKGEPQSCIQYYY